MEQFLYERLQKRNGSRTCTVGTNKHPRCTVRGFDCLISVALGIRTVSSMMQTKLTSQDKVIKKKAAVQAKRKAATRKFGTRLATTT